MQSDTPRTDKESVMPADRDECIVTAHFARQLEAELAAAIQQRDEAQANLARVVAQRDGYLEGNRQTLRALAEANEIAARYKRQRDEARVRVCELCVRLGGVYRRVNREVVECKTVEEIAEVCGWDCYAQQEGGGA